MKMFLISDNVDTFTGLKLAGVSGVVVHEKEEIEEALGKALEDKDIGVIVVTEKIAETARGAISEVKGKNGPPLVIEIPDRHGEYNSDIEKYISSSIGM